MKRSIFFKSTLFLLGAFLMQPNAHAVPIQYTNIDHMSTMMDALKHLAFEGDLNGLMNIQNAINGLPGYFSNSSLLDNIQRTMDTYENIDKGIKFGEDVKDKAEKVLDKVSFSDFFFKKAHAANIPGAGFISGGFSGSTIVKALNELNPFSGFMGKKETEEICGDLKTAEGVKTCYYIDNEKDPSIIDAKDIRSNLTKGQYAGVGSLFSDATAVINATAKFKDVETKTNESTPKTVSEALTKRAETDIAFNVIGGSALGLEMSRIEMDALTIYNTINGIDVGGGLF